MQDINTLDARADPVVAFRDNRDRLGRIIGAAVTAGAPDGPGYRVELRDYRGARLSVSDSRPSSHGDDPGRVLQVLLEAGFAPEVAAAVRTHRVVRLARTSDGTTSLEQASLHQSVAADSTGDLAVRGAAQLPAEPARRVINAFASRRHIILAEVAAELNLDAALVQAVFHRRWIPWEAADAIAVALGHHPCDLWPEWFPPQPAAAGAARA